WWNAWWYGWYGRNGWYGWNGNVIRFPDQNTLNTKVKQIRNPQKEISGGFFMIELNNVRKI
ncbi:MAG: hypothetical protein ABS05_03980, partial [Pelagibacteraceae bacterium BACL5 MAG-121128-bin54]